MVERKNRTVVDMARCLMHEMNVRIFMWAEVASTLVYLVNKAPIQALSSKTPYEAITGMKPLYHTCAPLGVLLLHSLTHNDEGKWTQSWKDWSSLATMMNQKDTNYIILSQTR